MPLPLAVLTALALTLPPAPAAAPEERLDRWIAPLVASNDLAGAVLARHRGRDLVRRAYGMSDAGGGVANTVTTRFEIGSISKQFTAAAVLALRDAGRLSLDDPLGSHLGWITPESPAGRTDAMESAGPPPPPAAAAITLLDLLTHRSGLLRDVPEGWPSDDLGALCRRILDTPPDFEPGSRTVYSNAGYVVLACVVERLTGERFEDHLGRTLFEPLGLSSTGFWDGRRPLRGQARGYDPGGPAGELRPTPADDKRRHLGAAGIVSTVDDLARWTESLAAGRVLGPDSTREMLADAGDGRGYGVGFYRRGGRRVIGHDGVTNGYTAFLEWYPDDELVVAYAGNVRTSAFEHLEDALPALALGGDLPQVDRPETLAASHDGTAVGSFRVHEALVLDVELRPSGLELRGTGGYFTPLLRIEGDSYWYPALYARVDLERDADGAVTGLVWRTVHGQSFEIPRSDG